MLQSAFLVCVWLLVRSRMTGMTCDEARYNAVHFAH